MIKYFCRPCAEKLGADLREGWSCVERICSECYKWKRTYINQAYDPRPDSEMEKILKPKENDQ